MKRDGKEKTVFWLSRHPMAGEQFCDLERVMGGPVQLLTWTDTVEDMEELRPTLEQVDAVAAVLPIEKLAQLLEVAGDKPVLQANAQRVMTGRWIVRPDGQREKETAFFHNGWRRILEVHIKAKTL